MLLGLLLSLSLMQTAVTGTVKDTSGGAVAGASVIVRTESGGEQQTVTGPDGRFTIDNAPDSATLVVRAVGFAEKRQPLTRRRHRDRPFARHAARDRDGHADAK